MALQDPYDRLAAPGEVNDELPDRVEERDDGGYRIDEDGTVCELCRINRYPFQQDETVFYEDEDSYVVETADLKGHDIRTMVVVKDHASIPAPDEKEAYLDELKRVTAGLIGDGEMLVFGSMQTFSDHWHAIACDLEGEDLERIHDVERYRVDDHQYEQRADRVESPAGELIL